MLAPSFEEIHTVTQPARPMREPTTGAVLAGYRKMVLTMIDNAISELDSPDELTADAAYHFLMTDALTWLDWLHLEVDRDAWRKRVMTNDFEKEETDAR